MRGTVRVAESRKAQMNLSTKQRGENLTVVVFFARWLDRGRRETLRQITPLYWRDAKKTNAAI